MCVVVGGINSGMNFASGLTKAEKEVLTACIGRFCLSDRSSRVGNVVEGNF